MPFKPERTDHLLRDIEIRAVHRELRPVYRLAERETVAPNGRSREWDLQLREGLENLAQAIILRLLTPRGELAPLGHPEYGSRIHELIGRENSGSQRNLLRLFALEALQFEPRIEKVVELVVASSRHAPSTVDVLLRVKPVASSEVVTIGPFSIDLGVS